MAAIDTSQNGQAVKGRTKKPVPRVDLTAMVDLAFLLITFFMLTTSLSKKYAMDLVKPVPLVDVPAKYPESRTMTILLGKNNKAVCYMGEAKNALMKIINLSVIQKEILANKALVAQTHQDAIGKRMLVIIKPTSTSIYKNFVDVIDEMSIARIDGYAIDDKVVLAQERDFMMQKGI